MVQVSCVNSGACKVVANGFEQLLVPLVRHRVVLRLADLNRGDGQCAKEENALKRHGWREMRVRTSKIRRVVICPQRPSDNRQQGGVVFS